MVPHADRAEDIPYYHPVLRKLAFRYSSAVPPVDGKGCEKPEAAPETSTPDQPPVRGTISISILPFVEESDTEPVSAENGSRASTGTISGEILSSDILPNRTYRTCLHLLETLHKHGWGRLTGYQKRVVHDVGSDFIVHLMRCNGSRPGYYAIPIAHSDHVTSSQVIVEKTSFQDLYLILKERHKHLDSRVKKVRSNILEDLKRHVWKVSLSTCIQRVYVRTMPDLTRRFAHL